MAQKELRQPPSNSALRSHEAFYDCFCPWTYSRQDREGLCHYWHLGYWQARAFATGTSSPTTSPCPMPMACRMRSSFSLEVSMPSGWWLGLSHIFTPTGYLCFNSLRKSLYADRLHLKLYHYPVTKVSVDILRLTGSQGRHQLGSHLFSFVTFYQMNPSLCEYFDFTECSKHCKRYQK